MSKWVETTLGDFVSLQRGHDLPSSDRVAGNVPVVGSGGVTGWHNEAKVAGPGITVGRAANLGVPTIVEEDFWPLNTTLYVKDFRGNDVRFTYHLFQVLDLSGYDSGSVQPMLNRNYIRSIPINVPPFEQQRAIANVLGGLDNKIAVNDQIAATALDLAECLYVSESSESAGWREWALAETAKWLSGGTPKTSESTYWSGTIPWISAASLKTPWLCESDRLVTELGVQNGTRLVPRGSIIFVVRGMSLTTEFRIGIAQCEVAFGQDCKALIPRSEIDSATLFLAIRSQSKKILDMVDLAGHGTGRLSTDLIGNLKVKIPHGSAAREFTAKVDSLFNTATAASSENRILATLRDTLLPKLMSGELRVKDAEKTLEGVT